MAAARNSSAKRHDDGSNLPFAFRHYPPEQLKEALRKMYLIRRFEEGAEEVLYARPYSRHHASFHRSGSECSRHFSCRSPKMT